MTITVPVSASPHATSANTAKMAAFTGPQMTAQPRFLQVLTGEGSQTKAATQAVTQGVAFETEEAKSKLQTLEERLRVVEGGGHHGFGDVTDLCLVPDVIIPPKFIVPEFEKYKGTSCPKNHLTMYYRKMVAYTHDEKLLVHFFQDSLVDTTLNWYIHLEPARIRSWRDLVDAFLNQYKYNVDMAPDRLQL